MPHKIALIIRREYLSRVRKKSFLVMSILGPLLFAAMLVLPAWFASLDSSQEVRLAVLDPDGVFGNALVDTESIRFESMQGMDEAALRFGYRDMGYQAYLIPDGQEGVRVVSHSPVTMDVRNHVDHCLRGWLQQQFLASRQIEGLPEIIREMDGIRVKMTTVVVSDEGVERESSSEMTMLLSVVFSMMVYLFVMIYGAQVMRGVMEEKTSRIVEVIVSSVRPFELMMGKIVGVALVALTQVGIWIVLTALLVSGLGLVAGSGAISSSGVPAQVEMVTELQGSGAFEAQMAAVVAKVDWGSMGWSVAAFVYFFLGGYLLYAGLFAAVGSAIDAETDSQQFVLPIMIPLILSIYVAMSAYRDPMGDLAFWFSMVPFTSPVVMMARLPFQIPLWEIVLSMGVLAVSFVGMTWFAGRVYRTGILMYGKKVSYREMWRWFREAGR